MPKKRKKQPVVSDDIKAKINAFFTFTRKQQREILTVISEGHRDLQKVLSSLPDSD